MTVFFIKNPNPPGERLVTCAELRSDQRSLGLSEWKPVLQEHGWKLDCPPKVNVFYAENFLNIDAEIPESMMEMKAKPSFQSAITDYNRAVASLIFPHTNISELPVQPNTGAIIGEMKAKIGTDVNEIQSPSSGANH